MRTQLNPTNFCTNILLLVVLACQPPFLRPCSSAPALSSPPHSSAVDRSFCSGWSLDSSSRSCSSALDARTTFLRPCSSALHVLTTFLWPLIASAVIPCLQRCNALLEQPVMRLASRASSATVTISVVAPCHWQRVQGGDQFYRQPLLAAVPYHCCAVLLCSCPPALQRVLSIAALCHTRA